MTPQADPRDATIQELRDSLKAVSVKRPLKLKIEMRCTLNPDGSMGRVEVTTSAPCRSGYTLRNPFDSPAYTLAGELFEGSFKRIYPPVEAAESGGGK